jgi:hypothetical protein
VGGDPKDPHRIELGAHLSEAIPLHASGDPATRQHVRPAPPQLARGLSTEREAPVSIGHEPVNSSSSAGAFCTSSSTTHGWDACARRSATRRWGSLVSSRDSGASSRPRCTACGRTARSQVLFVGTLQCSSPTRRRRRREGLACRAGPAHPAAINATTPPSRQPATDAAILASVRSEPCQGRAWSRLVACGPSWFTPSPSGWGR